MSVKPVPGRLTLAVVVPTLNEQDHLPTTLDSLQMQTDPADRLLIVDGGSRDGTTALAVARGLEVLTVPGRGRGGQIAAGIRLLTEEVILVAHADMRLPATALEAVRTCLASTAEIPGGALGHRFRSPRWIYRLIEWYDERRARRGWSYGDQAQFFRREALLQAGGFPDQPIMEDVELSRRLLQLGRPAYLDLPVEVSPRRFERRGILRTLAENWWFRLAYRWRGLAACPVIYRDYYRQTD